MERKDGADEVLKSLNEIEDVSVKCQVLMVV